MYEKVFFFLIEVFDFVIEFLILETGSVSFMYITHFYNDSFHWNISHPIPPPLDPAAEKILTNKQDCILIIT